LLGGNLLQTLKTQIKGQVDKEIEELRKEENEWIEELKTKFVNLSAGFTESEFDLYGIRCPIGYKKTALIEKTSYCCIFEGYHEKKGILACLKQYPKEIK